MPGHRLLFQPLRGSRMNERERSELRETYIEMEKENTHRLIEVIETYKRGAWGCLEQRNKHRHRKRGGEKEGVERAYTTWACQETWRRPWQVERHAIRAYTEEAGRKGHERYSWHGLEKCASKMSKQNKSNCLPCPSLACSLSWMKWWRLGRLGAVLVGGAQQKASRCAKVYGGRGFLLCFVFCAQ